MKKIGYVTAAVMMHTAVLFAIGVLVGLVPLPDVDVDLNMTAGTSTTKFAFVPPVPEPQVEFIEVKPKLVIPEVSETIEKQFLSETIHAEAPTPFQPVRYKPELGRISANIFDRIPKPESVADAGAEAQQIAPVEVHTPPPVYPRVGRRRGHEGVTVVAFTIDVDGRCIDIEVAESSGYSSLDSAATAAVEKWRFEPGRKGGNAVATTKEVRFVFRLTE